MKKIILLSLLLSITALAQTAHTNTLTWTWTQGTGQADTQFNVMQATASGGCAQPFNATTCTQVGTTPPTQLTFTTSAATDPLVEGNTYCYVVVAQGAGGLLSANSNEQCVTVKKTLSAPILAPVVSN